MNLEKLFNGRALYTEKDRIWVAKGMTFFAIDYTGKRVTKKFHVGTTLQTLLSVNRISRQLLREGIHHLVPLNNGDIFLTTKRKALTVGKDGGIKHVFSGYVGNKPGHQGVCVTPDGTVFFGEYSINLDHKNQTKLYRSVDNAMSFTPVLTFDRTVRHIHFIKFDPYEKCLWLGTGDSDEECHLMRSDDNGDTWKMIGTGNQNWRAIGICFTKDALLWATDAGSVPDQNHIIRMDRRTNQLEILSDAEGPGHGCASFSDGRVFLSTGVEGGENEKDRFARMKQVVDNSVTDIFKFEKDILPLIIQYGVLRFPLGTDNCSRMIVNAFALKHGGECVYIEA